MVVHANKEKLFTVNGGIQLQIQIKHTIITCNVIEILVNIVKTIYVSILIMKIIEMIYVIITMTRTILNVLLMNIIIMNIMEMIITRKIT